MKAFAKEAKKFSRLAVGEPTTSAAGAGAAAAARRREPRGALGRRRRRRQRQRQRRRADHRHGALDRPAGLGPTSNPDRERPGRSPRRAFGGLRFRRRVLAAPRRAPRRALRGVVFVVRRGGRVARRRGRQVGGCRAVVGVRARLIPKETDPAGASRAMLGVEMRRLGSTRVANAWVTALAWVRRRRLAGGRRVRRDWAMTARAPRAAARRNTSGTPLLERSETFCAADGVTVTALAVDETANRGSLVAAGKASGAVSVFRTEPRAPENFAGQSSRVFFEPAPAPPGASRLSGVSRRW